MGKISTTDQGHKKVIQLQENEVMQSVKKRLKRNNSYWGNDSNRKIHQNESRDALIVKGRTIFDFVIDNPMKDDPTLSSIVADCVRYETEWSKAPRTKAAANSISPDKLRVNNASGGLTGNG